MKNIPVLIMLFLCMVGQSVQAIEYDGVQFPDEVTLDGTDQVLQLNGIGMRTKFVFDVYIGALYTSSPASTRNQVLEQNAPNRILMHFVFDEVEAHKLIDGWNDGFEENQDDESLQVLKSRIDTFNAMFSTVKAGDEILLDYIPGKGTQVTIRGEQKGVIEDKDFNAALLDIWLGEEPADEDLKDAMLGESSD